MNYKHHKNNNLEMMMLNITIEGQREVWKEIEKTKNAWERIEKRKLFTKALNKLNEEKI